MKKKHWTDTDNDLTMKLYEAVATVIAEKPGPEAALACAMNLVECYEPDATKEEVLKFIGVIWERRPRQLAQ